MEETKLKKTRNRPCKPREWFIEKAMAVHGDTYDYSQVEYQGTKKKVVIICKLHGPFEQSPEKHFSGCGCPHPECVQARKTATNLKKYGTAHPMQARAVQDKAKRTSLERYGVDNAMKSQEVQKKLKASCQEKYGSDYAITAPEVQAKRQRTVQSRYGGTSPFSDKAVHRKAVAARKANGSYVGYPGDANPARNPDVRAKINATMTAKYGGASPFCSDAMRAMARKTMLVRYGVDHPMHSNEIRLRVEATCLARYGVRNVMGLSDAVDKIQRTKREHNSFNVSGIENMLYGMLVERFGADDVLRQYKSDPRYPWLCDFYVKSRDMFIELNGNWTHGGYWYEADDLYDCERVRQWSDENHGGPYYRAAVHTWTVSDVRKRQAARENHLNYVVFWDTKLRDAKIWFGLGCPDGMDWDRPWSWYPDN